jgi:hypothetical protein
MKKFLQARTCFIPETLDRKLSNLKSKFMKQCIHIRLYKLVQYFKNNLQATTKDIINAHLVAKNSRETNMTMFKTTHDQQNL